MTLSAVLHHSLGEEQRSKQRQSCPDSREGSPCLTTKQLAYVLRPARRLLSRALMRWESSDARGGSTDSPAPSCDCRGPASNTCASRPQVSGALHTNIPDARTIRAESRQRRLKLCMAAVDNYQRAGRCLRACHSATQQQHWGLAMAHKAQAACEQQWSKSGCRWSACLPVQQWAGACLRHKFRRDVAA